MQRGTAVSTKSSTRGTGRSHGRPILRNILLLAAGLVLLGGLGPWLLTLGSSSARAADPDGDVLTAGSVCEAQRLKARKAEDPHLQISIPDEYNQPWPSLAACESAEAAWDEDAPGPNQPIPFSHKHHAGEFQIECQYCHSGTDRSPSAGVPSVELCMGCHAQFPPSYDEIEGIRILKQHWEEKRPIEWVQIHRLPEYVQFPHNRHIAKGIECQQCHGPVEKLDKLYLVPDDSWWYLVPVKKMEMGWCLQCHRSNDHQASQDCMRCHY